MKKNAKIFLVKLARKFAQIQDDLFEHLEDNDGEILAHLLMADYCRRILSTESSEKWISNFLDDLEQNFSVINDDEVSNIIGVSFIEHLPPPHSNHPIAQNLGYKLKEHYNIIFGIST